jgi:hypothetical protein
VIPDEVQAVRAAYLVGQTPDRAQAKGAVKATLAALVERAPGRSVEVRIPPFAAVQAVAGHTHRRGTPAAVVEMDAATWIALACGDLTWQEGVSSGRVHASGERSDLGEWLPLFG